MRVLQVTPRLFGDGFRGGGERYVSELSDALRAKGHLVGTVEKPRVLRHRVMVPDKKLSRGGVRAFLQAIMWADVVHVHQLNSPGFDWASVICSVLRKPLVLTDHGGGFRCPGRLFGRHRLRLISAAAYVSHWSSEDIDPKGLIRKSAIIYGGGDHLPAVSKKIAVADFGFVGRILPHKGLHTLVAALPSNCSLVVLGEKRDLAYFAEIQLLAKGKQVFFSEVSSDHDVSNLYASVKCLVVPSVEKYKETTYTRPELLGLVALEALAAGTPVVGSRVGGLGELLEMAGQRVVNPGAVDELRDVLSELRDADRVKVVSADYSWATVAEKCIDLYIETISNIQ